MLGIGMGGMYPGMGMGMMNPMMNPMMMGMGGMYGMPRYPPTMYAPSMGYGYGGYGAMYDPMMGYGAPPASMFVDENVDAHRIEHAYRQSAPDSYGVGMSMMPGYTGGMAQLPGSQMMLYGRGMGYHGWYA
ncbi:hypothetical protein DB88DRAFT_470006 [Papiliotrema laurentii]|uniref:Uncharacterized protein n=1 Tax=Papiliotrema laurentii TaxID=5418 RepID=A0AAD9FW40_PAPLA|nr:hypothetical protein DB88DRAFT_470006 [Papiliotrema laurentii]